MWYRLSQQMQLPDMDVEQTPVEKKPRQEKQPKEELLETQKEPKSLFFNEWSQGYEVPEQPVYHGTTKEFDRFDINKGFNSSYFGPGFYFSSDKEDVEQNYTGNGPDQRLNIENYQYDLLTENDYDEHYLFNLYGDDPRYSKYFLEDGRTFNPQLLTEAIARDHVLGENVPRVIPAHIRMENPIHLTDREDEEHPERTFYDDAEGGLEFLNNDVDSSDYHSFKTALQKLHDILLDYWDSDITYEICEELAQEHSQVNPDENITASGIFMDLIPKLEFYDTDQDTKFKGEIIQRFVNALGHDSIVMEPNQFFRMYSGKDRPIKHYITWNPENIKHARQNIEFDPKNPVITASRRYSQLEPETNEEWMERHKVDREGDKYVFYHGSRIDLTYLRAGSLLATSPQEAIDFGDTNYWNDRRLSFKVYKVKVSPEEIHPGYWASLVSDHPVELYYKVSRKKGS